LKSKKILKKDGRAKKSGKEINSTLITFHQERAGQGLGTECWFQETKKF